MPKNFMDKDFLLNSETARKLFHGCAAQMPIYDYHCHLSPEAMYEDKPFENIAQIFLGGDHYKWRFMRSFGIDEEYITGSAEPYEKFKKFIGALQYGIGNPMYHWTHLELKRYFGVDETVREDNADVIWSKCNKVIQDTKMSPSTLINGSNVAVICTTDAPNDTLEFHKKIREKGHINAKVLPTFRPDLSKIDEGIVSRIDYFHENGCRLSDHAIDGCFDGDITERLVLLGREYAKRGWVMQLHIGALRNNNSKMFKKLGADAGYDSINDFEIAQGLSNLLDLLDRDGLLPKTILYTLNPKDNYTLATMLGNFQSSEACGKIQFGSGWWFNDQKDGMLEQMKALANLGAISTFVGMLTDSRSFLSYTRHEYFRRIMCNLLGEWVENGEFPADMDTLEVIVKGICFDNAKNYFGIEL